MKKTLIVLTGALLCALMTFIAANKNIDNSLLCLVSNIEALAGGESSPSGCVTTCPNGLEMKCPSTPCESGTGYIVCQGTKTTC